MLKAPCAPCPKCKAVNPAEYAQMNQPARWTCHCCSATGELAGDVARRTAAGATTQQQAPGQPKRHWSARR